MSQHSNRHVHVLGSGPLAEELAAAYRHLGWSPTLGRTPHAQPDLVAVADDMLHASDLEALEVSGAEVVPSISTCSVTFDRDALRTTAADELGLPTLTHELAQTAEELPGVAERIGYPLVVKPRRGRGQLIVRDAEELANAPVLKPFPTHGVVVERFIAFDYELTILTARSVDPATGELATWFCEPIGTRHAGGDLVECWQPAPLPDTVRDNARSIAARVTNALECCGIYAIELFVDGEEVYFSAVLPLPGLDGMLTRATQRLDQFEIHSRATLRLPIDVTLVSPGASQIVYGANTDPEALARAMTVEETGVQVLGRDVLVRSTGESVEEARERAARAAEELR